MKVFPIYYFPPISWFAAAQAAGDFLLESHEHYRKQQYFNRTRIMGANGPLSLSIPIVKAPEKTILIKRMIAYEEDWQKNHWKSLESAYRSSPFFEYYEDRFAPFYEERWDSLLEYNLKILKVLLELLEMDASAKVTGKFYGSEHYETDYRPEFNARKGSAPTGFSPAEYAHVFNAFCPDLSILDLLFNEGPAAASILKNSWSAP